MQSTQPVPPEFLEEFGGPFLMILVWWGLWLIVSVVVCFLLYDAQKRVPPRFRQIEPAMVWLLLIPCFNIVWNFIALPKISRSYKAYFESIGRRDVGGCGEGFALGYSA